MHFKQLLTFDDVAVELDCDEETVRSLIVEEHSLPVVVVTHTGDKKPYSESLEVQIGAGGMVFDSYDRNHHLGYLRVQREDLDGFKAKYGLEEGRTRQAAKAPWPNHETKKLTALRLAAGKFWSNYDPAQPDTAPKNEAVIEWLRNEHGIKATPAEEMASILRPDTLRTGPR